MAANELYVAAARDLPISFHGPIAVRVLVGGSSKPAWTSAPVDFDKYCAWDFRNPEHTFMLPSSSSVVLELVTATKGSGFFSFFFFFFESSSGLLRGVGGSVSHSTCCN